MTADTSEQELRQIEDEIRELRYAPKRPVGDWKTTRRRRREALERHRDQIERRLDREAAT